MKKIYLLVLVMLFNINANATSCEPEKKITCDSVKKYKIISTADYKPEQSEKVHIITNGKCVVLVENITDKSSTKFISEACPNNDKIVNAVFYQHICGDYGLQAEKSNLVMKIKENNHLAIWPSNSKCSERAISFFNSLEKNKNTKISLYDLENNNYEMLSLNRTEAVFFSIPARFIKVDVSKNYCKYRICSKAQKMPIIHLKYSNIFLLNDHGKLYYPEKFD